MPKLLIQVRIWDELLENQEAFPERKPPPRLVWGAVYLSVKQSSQMFLVSCPTKFHENQSTCFSVMYLTNTDPENRNRNTACKGLNTTPPKWISIRPFPIMLLKYTQPRLVWEVWNSPVRREAAWPIVSHIMSDLLKTVLPFSCNVACNHGPRKKVKRAQYGFIPSPEKSILPLYHI